MKRKHDPGNEEPYACDMCDKYETRISELQRGIERRDELLRGAIFDAEAWRIALRNQAFEEAAQALVAKPGAKLEAQVLIAFCQGVIRTLKSKGAP